MNLMNYELLPGVVASVKDTEHLGRIKVCVPGGENPSNCQLEAMPWCYPFTMTGTYQGFTKLTEGCKVWVLRNMSENLEMWWIPMFDLNPNTQNVVDSYDNVDVLISRDLGGNNAYIYYSDSKGIVLSIGNSVINISPKGIVSLRNSSNAKISLEGEMVKLNTGATDNFVPLSSGLKTVIDDITACLEDILNNANASWTTKHLSSTLQKKITQLKQDSAMEKVYSSTVAVG